uniref:1-acylglycerol-3-phosphate O-acyltransferase ABHD5 n=1 Tax=Panagrolaimus superbus TaxID=310955 RepID=A0A914Y1T4_9BILA
MYKIWSNIYSIKYLFINRNLQHRYLSLSCSAFKNPLDKTSTKLVPPPDPGLDIAIEEQAEHQVGIQTGVLHSKLLNYIGWDQFNIDKLIKAEKALLGNVKSKLKSRQIPIELWDSKIYTISLAEDSFPSKIPFVLLHGFGAGIGIWAANLDELAKGRSVHAIDLLGFGRSSRPSFSSNSTSTELEYIKSIEDWRKSMKIDKMIIVGHSFGGYLASSYALEHPENVRHLVLVDPWGMPERPKEMDHSTRKIPFWAKALSDVMSQFSPLTSLRIAGPYATSMIRRLRPDLGIRYNITDSDPNAIYEYIYQINAQKPTGEIAFKTMSLKYGWAKRPMLNRITKLNSKVPMSFLFGARSWISSSSGYKVKEERPQSYVDVNIISNAGHHVYADNQEEFNRVMSKICKTVESNQDLQ